MTIKMIYLAKRNPALSEQEFPQRWKEHSALSAGFPQLKSMVSSACQCSNVRDLPVYPGASLNYDGVNLLKIRDKETASMMWNDPDVVATLRPDEQRVFSDHVINFTMMAEEIEVVGAPQGRFCLFVFGKRKAAFSRDRFLEYWIQNHEKLLCVVPSMRHANNRFVVNGITDTPPPGYDYDGISELWFDTLEQVGVLAADVRYRSEVLPDLFNFCEAVSSITMLTRVTHARPALTLQI